MSNWSDIVKLVGLIEGTDQDGFPGVVEGDPRRVFANKKSIRSSEYYLAKQSGIELSYMFEIRSIEYDGEKRLYFNDDPHTIERTYEKGEFIELICKRKSEDHGI